MKKHWFLPQIKRKALILESHGIEFYISLYDIVACESCIPETGQKFWVNVTEYNDTQLRAFLGY